MCHIILEMGANARSKGEIRKVSQTGNGSSVGLRKSVIDTLNIKRGDKIELEVKETQIILNKKSKLEDRVDSEPLEMFTETFEEHHDVFKNLKEG